MSFSKTMTTAATRALGGLAIGLAVTLATGIGPASAWYSFYDSHTAPIPDWEVFGFDLSSVPGDTPSLLAFRASLDPLTQRAVTNRCQQEINQMPNRFSPKVRRFCWGR
jgi:hypothetical protein